MTREQIEALSYEQRKAIWDADWIAGTARLEAVAGKLAEIIRTSGAHPDPSLCLELVDEAPVSWGAATPTIDLRWDVEQRRFVAWDGDD